jgi:ADP-ribosylglycohydrolase
VLGDAFGESWFLPSELFDTADALCAARELRPGPWPWTDDSAMGGVLYRHLLRHGEVKQDELARDFAAEYARDPDRGYGPSMHRALRRIGEGDDWRAVTGAVFSGQGSLGNGAAMRVGPLGAWFADEDLGTVAGQARLSAEVTHAHPEAAAGAVAVAVAAALCARRRPDVRRAAQGTDGAPEFLTEVARHLPPDSDVRSGLTVAAALPVGTSVRHAAAVLGSGVRLTAPDTVPFALWAAAAEPTDLVATLWRTVAGWGDRDTTCAIAGSVVAAGTGLAGVPDAWREAQEPFPTG